jgi:hypothetical protein
MRKNQQVQVSSVGDRKIIPWELGEIFVGLAWHVGGVMIKCIIYHGNAFHRLGQVVHPRVDLFWARHEGPT